MANPEHVEIVRKGKDAIDQWRQNLKESKPRLDLSGAYLYDAKLAGADLCESQLSKVDFGGQTWRKQYFVGRI